MKRLILTLATAIVALSATAQPDLTDPHSVSEGAIATHTKLTPYPTREDALSDTGTSVYIVPLEWVRQTTANGADFSTVFKYTVRDFDREIVLRICGATAAVKVTVNNREAGYSTLGGVCTEFDLTKLLQENKNTITISLLRNYAASQLSSAPNAEVGFDSAEIVLAPKVMVSDIVAATTWNGSNGLLNLGVVMQSRLLNSKNYKIAFELYSPEGVKVAEGEKELATRMLSRDTVRFFARIADAKAWSDAAPNLYTVVVRTEHERRTKEFVSRKVGFRTVATDPEGRLLINGKAVAINAAEASTAAELEELKAKGYNMVYVSPAPRSDEFYAAADRLGLYVCDQADIRPADATANLSNDPAWKEAYMRRATAMYHSSKGHPSVVAFSIARNAGNGICLYESYLNMKSIELSRPVIYPEADGEWNSDKLQ